MTKEEILQQCTIDGNIVKLPEGQLDKKLYMEVAKSLELIGGKWKGGKIAGFVFPSDPTELLQQIAGGESRNLKKEFQFFETPDTLADELVELAEIQQKDEVLEPSAGQGSIVKAIHRKHNYKTVWGFELMDVNQTFLNKLDHFHLLGNDFLTECDSRFDKIIANPPFTKNQDIDHIYKMYYHLKPGGRLVSVSSTHWEKSNNKKEMNFKYWLNEVGAKIQKVPSGTFKQSGTMISSVIIIINK
jgi:phospholipid N-methyltransferase